jgi:hypothetical protein
MMVLKERAGSHSDAVGIRPSVFSGLQMKEKLGFARAFRRAIHEVPVQTPAGLYLGKRLAFDVNLDRLDRVVVRITRGLFWHHHRSRIPDGFEVTVFSEDGLRGLDAHESEQFRRTFVIPVLNKPQYSVGRGVMRTGD